MPTINRFRVVNFKYDNDKKYIANELFDFKGKNTLINLENGGGKSVILQLALQVLIPTAELSGRKFVDYFKVNSGTVHILIEWQLDGLTREYLLTGICASRDSEGLRYFTYTHAYNSPNDCDIQRIQVVNSSKVVTGYTEFNGYLRTMKSQFRINTYSKDRKKRYTEKLEEYNLLENEFEAIRIINQSEGGIAKFFEKAEKSRHVIEKLIIPAIPSLYGEEQKLLSDTFSKHMENLKNIPLLQQKIEIYQQFIHKGSQLLGQLNAYDNQAHSHADIGKEIFAFENMLVIVDEHLQEEINRLENDKQSVCENLANAEYISESLTIHLLGLERKKIQQEQEFAAFELSEAQKRLSVQNDNINRMEATNICLELRELRTQLQQLKANLNMIEIGEEQALKDYQDLLHRLKELLVGKQQSLAHSYEESIIAMASVEEEKTAFKLLWEENSTAILNVSTKLGINKAEKGRLEKDYQKLSSRFIERDISLLLSPSDSILVFNEMKTVLETEMMKTEIERTQIAKKEEDLTNRNVENGKRQVHFKGELGNKTKELDKYDRLYADLHSRVIALGIEGELLTSSVAAQLDALLGIKISEQAEIIIRHNTMENRKLILKDLDYYISDKSILEAQQGLEDNGVPCINGALWLRNQPANMRATLLDQNPLLPYALIVDPSQMEKLFHVESKLKTKVDDFPVIIITNKDIRYPDEAREDIALGMHSSKVFVLNFKNRDLFLNPQQLDAHKLELISDIEKCSYQLNVLKEDHESISEIKSLYASFLSEYGGAWKHKAEIEIAEITAKLDDLRIEESKVADEIRLCKESISKCDASVEEIRKSLDENQIDIVAMQGILENNTNVSALSATILMLESCKAQLEEVQAKLKHEEEALIKKADQSKINRNSLENQYNAVNGRIKEVQDKINTEKPEVVLLDDLEEVEAKTKAIENKIYSGDKVDIEGRIKQHGKIIDDYSDRLQKYGFEESEFINAIESYSKQELKRQQDEATALKIVVDRHDDESKELEKKFINLAARIDLLNEQLDEKYGKAIYVFKSTDSISPEIYQSHINNFNEKLRQIGKKILEVKSRRTEIDKLRNNLKDFIEDRKIELLRDLQDKMLQLKGYEESIHLYDMLRMKPDRILELIKRYKADYDASGRTLSEKQKEVEDCFQDMYVNQAWNDNDTVKVILSGIMKENLFNVSHVNAVFERLFESVERMVGASQLQLDECTRNKAELIERCLSKAALVYGEVKMVDSFSKIKMHGETLKIIKIEMPKLDEENSKARMTLYIERCIEDIGKLKESGKYDPAKIDTIINGYMQPQQLLDAVVNLNDISIKVFKPEHNLQLSQYIDWEIVVKWSGGEKLAGFFAMLISIVSYLRYKKTGTQNSTKVIWIDNPFGQANAGHLLEYIFELAKASRTQMICLSGLKESNIYAQFDVVYSLVHKMLSRFSIIQSKAVKTPPGLEVGYYSIDNEQMQLI